MRILLVSDNGWGGFLLNSLMDDGHEGHALLHGRHSYHSGKFKTSKSFDAAINAGEPDFIVADHPCLELTQAEECGIPCIGHPIEAKLENDFSFAMDRLQQNGVKVVPYKEHSSAKQAIDMMDKEPDYIPRLIRIRLGQDREWVFKTNNSEEAKRRLDFIHKAYGAKPVILQQLGGTTKDASVWGIFNGKKFMNPAILAFRNHECGCCDEVDMMAIQNTDRIFQVTLKKLSTFLKSLNYHGFIGVNVRANMDSGMVEVYEIVCGLKPTTAEVFFQGLKGSPGKFLRGVASEEFDDYDFTEERLSGRRVVTHPHPRDMPWLGEEKAKMVEMALAFPGVGLKAEMQKDTEATMVWGQVDHEGYTTGPDLGVIVNGSKSDLDIPGVKYAGDGMSIWPDTTSFEDRKLISKRRKVSVRQ